jgi:hypothetical protein
VCQKQEKGKPLLQKGFSFFIFLHDALLYCRLHGTPLCCIIKKEYFRSIFPKTRENQKNFDLFSENNIFYVINERFFLFLRLLRVSGARLPGKETV